MPQNISNFFSLDIAFVLWHTLSPFYELPRRSRVCLQANETICYESSAYLLRSYWCNSYSHITPQLWIDFWYELECYHIAVGNDVAY